MNSELRQGERGAGGVGFAGLGVEDRAKARVPAAVDRAEEAEVELRLVGERFAAADLEALGERRDLAEGRGRLAGERLRLAGGRVEGEAGAGPALHRDRAQVERDAVEDRRERVGDGAHLGGCGIEVDARCGPRPCRGRRARRPRG